jgi:hypothetical protein
MLIWAPDLPFATAAFEFILDAIASIFQGDRGRQPDGSGLPRPERSSSAGAGVIRFELGPTIRKTS